MKGICDREAVARFAALERVFSPEDYEYIDEMSGRFSANARAFYRGRREAGRRYLRMLRQEFHRLHKLARIGSIYAGEDQPEVARTLIREYVKFQFLWVFAHITLCVVASPFGARTASWLGAAASGLIEGYSALTVLPGVVAGRAAE